MQALASIMRQAREPPEMTLSISVGTVENQPLPFAFAFGVMYCMPMLNSRSEQGEPTAVHNREGREDLYRFRIACENSFENEYTSGCCVLSQYDVTPRLSFF
jgi:hypothetical protein